MAPRAIETRYAGCRFRSRIEARYARFFDHLRIPWEYEPEGFETSAGWYLPDFRIQIPQLKARRGYHQWFEVKPDGADEDPRHVAFAREVGDPVIVARGLPRNYADQLRGSQSPLMAYNVDGREPWPVAFCDSSDLSYEHHYCALGDNRHWCQEAMNHTLVGDTCHLALYGHHPATGDGDWQREYWTYPPYQARDIDRAYAAARSARFEHGKQG